MPQEINNYMKIKEAMENPYNETNNLYELSVDGSLLDMLLEIERVLDESHLYAYENWKEGCVVKGPEVKRHWVNIVLQYPKNVKGRFQWNTSVLKESGNVQFKQTFRTNDKLPQSQNKENFEEHIKKSQNKYG